MMKQTITTKKAIFLPRGSTAVGVARVTDTGKNHQIPGREPRCPPNAPLSLRPVLKHDAPVVSSLTQGQGDLHLSTYDHPKKCAPSQRSRSICSGPQFRMASVHALSQQPSLDLLPGVSIRKLPCGNKHRDVQMRRQEKQRVNSAANERSRGAAER